MKRLDATPVYLIYSGATALFFTIVFTLNLVYQAQTVGLSPFQLVLVGTTLETAAFLFEIPTGIVADAYSRRLSVIIGTALIEIGFLIEGSTPTFEAVLLSQVAWGIGATFVSGADNAWIADELGDERAGQVYMRGAQAGQLLTLPGIALAVLLGRAGLNVPVVIGGLLFLGLAVFLAIVMPEAGFRPAPREERTSWGRMFATLREGVGLVRLRPLLLVILLVSLVYGVYSEGFDRLYTPHLLSFGLPEVGGLDTAAWFGLIGAVVSVLSLGATESVRRRVNLQDSRAVSRALAWLYGGVALLTVAFALAGSFGLALLAYWATRVLRGTSDPLYTAWLNQHTASNVRATVFSMAAQANAVGQIAGGPAVGAIAALRSLRAALSVAGLLFLPVLALFGRARRLTPTPIPLDAAEAAPLSEGA